VGDGNDGIDDGDYQLWDSGDNDVDQLYPDFTDYEENADSDYPDNGEEGEEDGEGEEGEGEEPTEVDDFALNPDMVLPTATEAGEWGNRS